MTEKDKKKLRKKMETELARIKSDMEQLQTMATEEVEDSDEVTRMESLMAKRFNEASIMTMQSRYAALEYALKRIDDPEFGLCMECGESIGLARLNAMPETTTCIHCAS